VNGAGEVAAAGGDATCGPGGGRFAGRGDVGMAAAPLRASVRVARSAATAAAMRRPRPTSGRGWA